MSIDPNSTKVLLAIVAVLAALVGGSLVAIKKSKKRSNKVRQENITISGTGKVVGGDDNSKNN